MDVGAYEYQRKAPSAAVIVTPNQAIAGQPIVFDGAGSSDPDPGDALTYSWSFDDGTMVTGATVTHAFAAPGPHAGTLTVTDPLGLRPPPRVRARQPGAVRRARTPARRARPAGPAPARRQVRRRFVHQDEADPELDQARQRLAEVPEGDDRVMRRDADTEGQAAGRDQVEVQGQDARRPRRRR